MKINTLKATPRKIVRFETPPDEDPQLSAQDVEDVVEIFQTPLTGAYNWDYTEADNRIRKLYELGKRLNWNATMDIPWDLPVPQDAPADSVWDDYPPFQALSDEGRREFFLHRRSWNLSQFLHGEQGALLVASQLVSCAPTYNAKLYAASQTFDEARHVEVFNHYLQKRVGFAYPIGNGLKSILDKILTDHRWDLKFVGMQIVIEGLALAAFQTARNHAKDPVLRQLLEYVLRDEARHVTFGVNYLEEFVRTLSEEEREDRAMFAYEACVVSIDRFATADVFRHFGWDPEEALEYSSSKGLNDEFRRLLFTRVVPNLSRIGLLTDRVRPLYDKLGVLDFETLQSDADIDWADLSRPLERVAN